jgi:hypothetical protein
MSPTQTLRLRILAAAMASTPAPQPTSTTARGWRHLGDGQHARATADIDDRPRLAASQ